MPAASRRRSSLQRGRKRFGQHFLTDRSVVEAIISGLAIKPGDRIVEIGPGHGVLTALLANACGDLIAIEIDRGLVARLRARLPDVTVVEQDVLKVDFAEVIDYRPTRIVGNLPYNISTPLLNRLFDCCAAGQPIRDMHFMLQAEVVDRLAAVPGTKAWGRLSVIAQYHCEVHPLFDVDADAFSPRPKVESRFLSLTPRPPTVVADDVAALREVLRIAFSQRRKRLGNAVQSLGLDLPALGLDAGVRPGTIDVSGFVAMANQLTRQK